MSGKAAKPELQMAACSMSRAAIMDRRNAQHTRWLR
jgi:hypothetical protein